MKKSTRTSNNTAAGARKSQHAPLNKQPAIKSQAAVQNGMFLFTSDSWSLAYFNENDLHFVERELFG